MKALSQFYAHNDWLGHVYALDLQFDGFLLNRSGVVPQEMRSELNQVPSASGGGSGVKRAKKEDDDLERLSNSFAASIDRQGRLEARQHEIDGIDKWEREEIAAINADVASKMKAVDAAVARELSYTASITQQRKAMLDSMLVAKQLGDPTLFDAEEAKSEIAYTVAQRSASVQWREETEASYVAAKAAHASEVAAIAREARVRREKALPETTPPTPQAPRGGTPASASRARKPVESGGGCWYGTEGRCTMTNTPTAEMRQCSGPDCPRQWHHLCSITNRGAISRDIDKDENDQYNCGCHNKGTWSASGVFTRTVLNLSSDNLVT